MGARRHGRRLRLSRPAAGLRLLTLTCPGGIGKTRFAVQIAAGAGDRFAVDRFVHNKGSLGPSRHLGAPQGDSAADRRPSVARRDRAV